MVTDLDRAGKHGPYHRGRAPRHQKSRGCASSVRCSEPSELTCKASFSCTKLLGAAGVALQGRHSCPTINPRSQIPSLQRPRLIASDRILGSLHSALHTLGSGCLCLLAQFRSSSSSLQLRVALASSHVGFWELGLGARASEEERGVAMASGKVMDPDNLNQNVKKTVYAVRGELYLRASELQKEGKKVGLWVGRWKLGM